MESLYNNCSLYRMMAQRIGREYSHSQAKTLFRNLLDLSGKVEVTTMSVVVTLDTRAHNPYLAASGLADQPTPGVPQRCGFNSNGKAAECGPTLDCTVRL